MFLSKSKLQSKFKISNITYHKAGISKLNCHQSSLLLAILVRTRMKYSDWEMKRLKKSTLIRIKPRRSILIHLEKISTPWHSTNAWSCKEPRRYLRITKSCLIIKTSMILVRIGKWETSRNISLMRRNNWLRAWPIVSSYLSFKSHCFSSLWLLLVQIKRNRLKLYLMKKPHQGRILTTSLCNYCCNSLASWSCTSKSREKSSKPWTS